ncbi:ABC transporter substrate-binding protein [Pseudofrankia inefficax]|uniref:Extracellular solute-binding protein family 5 n=1 Tax=Pseudofrankia inefficax (strain DSM 45817 / CECT 9037 / DDB 130130 / EuI1c) TaxID=298654 RepID=E3J0J9_PSEI1|nr:ABC transporter substrate-binding protein [Pseudofrankia inefficax]ADP81628.1 extracellular solute-binding protein family 5 [Pseudofrankia inefficax]
MNRTLGRRAAKTAAAAVAAVLAATLAACGGGSSSSASPASKPPTDGTLTVGLLGDIGMPPDPATFYAGNGIAIMKNVYDGLVTYAPNTDQVKIAPQLATSWDVSADKLTYTFHLRSGVTFHDGTPFTSAAVMPSIARMASINGGPAYLAAIVASVDTPDDLTAVVHLKSANSAFLNYLASPFGPKMLSPTGLKDHAGTDQAQTYLKTHDLGAGPYELTTAEVGRLYVLTQYAKYWGGTSPFKTIRLPVYTDVSALELAFDKGDVQLLVNALPSSAIPRYASRPVDNYFLPMMATAQITTNPNKDFFATQPARMAYLQSINQKQLVSQVLGDKFATPATTSYARGMLPAGTDKQDITYDPSVMAAYAKTATDKSLTVGFQTNQPNGQKMANIIAAALQADGLDAKVQGYTTDQVFSWSEDPTKGPDTFIDASNGPDGGDPYMWGHVFWDKSGGIDFLQCDVPSVNATLDQAVATGDTSLYVKAAQEYTKNGCYYHLSNNNDWILAQKWITGIAEAHNIGAFEVDFSKIGIAKS